MNEPESTRRWGLIPYAKGIQHPLKLCTQDHGKIHRSLEFTFDPSDFVCDPSKIITCVLDQGSDALADG